MRFFTALHQLTSRRLSQKWAIIPLQLLLLIMKRLLQYGRRNDKCAKNSEVQKKWSLWQSIVNVNIIDNV